MRILHVVPTYLPAIRYGGPIVSVHGLCRALAQRGHDVHVYTTNIDGRSNLDVPLGAPVDIDDVKVTYFPTSFGRRIYRSPDMKRAARDHLRSFDIAHLHSVFLWPTTMVARMAIRNGVPYLLAPRGMLVADLIGRRSRFKKMIWIKAFERANLANADSLHMTSELEVAEFSKLGLPFKRMYIVPNGTDIPDAWPDMGCDDFLKRWDGRRIIATLGRINWKKGLDRLIEAMPALPDAELIVAGNDEEGFRATLERLRDRLGIRERVHFIGPAYGAKKWQLLSRADVFVMPSQSENFGNSALEAMACGCPVVVSHGVGLAETISNAKTGLVVEPTASGLAQGLSRILADPLLREEMGQAGRLLVQQKFLWPELALQMERAYLDCIMRKRHTGESALAIPGAQ